MPTDHDQTHRQAASGAGFDDTLGLVLLSQDSDGVTSRLEVGPIHLQPFGIVHGGVYCAIAESVASISGYLWLQHSGIGGTSVGVNNNTDFLKSVTEGIITARSRPIHRGRRQQLWSVDMHIDDGALVARSQVRLQNIAIPEPV